MEPFAHSENSEGRVHLLADHLNHVAEKAGKFAEAFGSEAFAYAGGLWHDLGKNSEAFQKKLALGEDGHESEVNKRVDHSTAGAIFAQKEFGPLALPIAFAIAGHHAGLADRVDLETRLEGKAGLLADALEPADKVVPGAGKPTPPPFLTPEPGVTADEQKRRCEFWIRMLFSCLVDADFLDTEKHFEGGELEAKKNSVQRGKFDAIADLKSKLDKKLSEFGKPVSRVNEIRAQVLADCREKGRTAPQGVFTLTAPTGAGKTLAGMAFALEQAEKHSLNRVIVVLPYTSIIDQNAEEYRKIFGSDNVIEHHSSLNPAKETDRTRLACENWDAPIIVTTSVQFLESLLANKPSRCRKLHNIAKSVVIFDEVQTLPIPHLLPIVDVLKELVRAYHVSLVLSTATQPALQHRKSGLSQVFPGFNGMTEIVSNVHATFEKMQRVSVDVDAQKTEWPELATAILAEEQILVITHRRQDARDLAELVPGSIHLSALMCPRHRRKRIQEITTTLGENAERATRGESMTPLRVISTQLVEAGVDLDFPVVFRAFAGFDSIAQAAGRCNRNGRLQNASGRSVPGRVRVYRAPTKPPAGTLRLAETVAETMLRAEPALEILNPKTFDPYFRRLYFGQIFDQAGIQSLRQGLRFKTTAESFRMIEDDWSASVVVPYDDDAEIILRELASIFSWRPDLGDRKAKAAHAENLRGLFRKLQQYTVSAPRQVVESKVAQTIFRPEFLVKELYVLDPLSMKTNYSEQYGLELKGPFTPIYPPDELVML